MLQFSKPLTTLGVLLTVFSLIGCTQTEPTQSSQSGNASAEQAASSTASPTDALPKVVATTAVLCDLTRQIAQETVALTCLMPPDQDPHVYTPTPSDRKALEDASLVLYGGYQYEPGLIKIVEAPETQATKVAVYEAAVPTPLMGEPHDHDHGHEAAGEAEADHEHEHEHEHEEAGAEADHAAEKEAEVPDPHVWHDAENGAQIVKVIQENLAKLVPEQAALYQTNATALTEELTQLNAWIQKQVATVPANNRKLVTTHEALAYYANAYGLTLAGAIEGISTDEKPSAARIRQLADQLKASQVPTIFVENTTSAKQLETVAREANVKIAEQPLFIEGPGSDSSPAPTYQKMFITNTCTIVEGLGGQCDRTSAPGGS